MAEALRKSKLGLHHGDTLESMRELAVSDRAVDRVPDAIALQEETLRLAKAHLGSDHSLTLLCMGELAENYTLAARLEEAIALHEEKLKLNVAKRGPDYPSTLISRERLASSYTSARQYQKGIAMQTENLERMRSKLPPDHPITLLCMSGLAGGYTATGQRGLAEPLLRECLTIRELVSADSWLTFRTKSSLGEALWGQKKYADAEPLLLAGYRGMKQREDKIPDSLRTLRRTEALRRLIDLYTSWEKPDEADKWRKILAEQTTSNNPAVGTSDNP